MKRSPFQRGPSLCSSASLRPCSTRHRPLRHSPTLMLPGRALGQPASLGFVGNLPLPLLSPLLLSLGTDRTFFYIFICKCHKDMSKFWSSASYGATLTRGRPVFSATSSPPSQKTHAVCSGSAAMSSASILLELLCCVHKTHPCFCIPLSCHLTCDGQSQLTQWQRERMEEQSHCEGLRAQLHPSPPQTHLEEPVR